MKVIANDSIVPSGFESHSFAGIGMSCRLLEPISLDSISNWEEITSDLQSWGKIPSPDSLSEISLSEDDRGPIAFLSG